MGMNIEDDQPEVYTIPDNFIKDGYILNGNIRFRNAVEAALMTGATALIFWNLPIHDWIIKLSVTITFSTPMLLIGIIGVNGDPISVFLKKALHWFQSKRILLYNGKVATVHTRPVESVLNRELPRDKIVYALGNFKRSHGAKDHDVLVEGRDFVFTDDDDFRREEAREKESVRKAEMDAKKEAAKAAKKMAIEKKKEERRRAKEEKMLARRAKKDAKAAPVTQSNLSATADAGDTLEILEGEIIDKKVSGEDETVFEGELITQAAQSVGSGGVEN